MKYNCCTLSDYNYLLKGLVLYDSLEKHNKEDFRLYYLCLDQKTYDKLKELNLILEKILNKYQNETKLPITHNS